MRVVFSRVIMLTALSAAVGCSDNKKQPEGGGATTANAAVASATPSAAAGASASTSANSSAAATAPSTATATPSAAAASPAVLDGVTKLRAKYEASVRELSTAVVATVAAEKKKQEAGAKKFGRVPMPASKLAKDASVLQVDVRDTKVMTVSVHALNASVRAGGGPASLQLPATGEAQARCPSLYTNEPAIDLLYSEPVYMVVTVKSDLCAAQAAERDREVARVKKLVEPNVKTFLEHSAKIPDPCEAGKAEEPTLGDDLKKLGVKRARVQCRKVDQSSWQAFGIRETDYVPSKTLIQPAWRTTAAKLQEPVFYLSDDAATGKPYLLTFGATRPDGVELETEFYLQ